MQLIALAPEIDQPSASGSNLEIAHDDVSDSRRSNGRNHHEILKTDCRGTDDARVGCMHGARGAARHDRQYRPERRYLIRRCTWRHGRDRRNGSHRQYRQHGVHRRNGRYRGNRQHGSERQQRCERKYLHRWYGGDRPVSLSTAGRKHQSRPATRGPRETPYQRNSPALRGASDWLAT